MNNSFGNLFGGDLSSLGIDLNGIDINKLLVIILLLTGKLDIEVIHIYRRDFAVTLGTFNTDL